MTTEELRERLAELKQRNRQARIERGLSPDPPKQKRPLPDDITVTLLDRMDNFADICVEIARLYRAGHFVVIDSGRLATYKKCVRLLYRSSVEDVKFYASKILFLLGIFEAINKRIADGDDDLDNLSLVHMFYGRVVTLEQDLSTAKYFFRRSIKDETTG